MRIDRVFIALIFPWLLWGEAELFLKLSKSDPYLGEPVVATLKVEYTPDTKVDNLRVVPPKSEAFEIRKLDEKSPSSLNGKILRIYRYLLIPLRSGSFNLPPFVAELTWQDPKTYLYTVHRYSSTERKLRVLEIPNSLELVGDFRLRLRSDRNSSEAYNPIHLEITLSGEGNLEYLKPFNLHIKDATIYPSAPKVSIRATAKGYISTFTQRFTVISDRDIKVPPLRLIYFNTKTAIAQTLQTPPLTIHINNPAARREFWLRAALLLGGALLGVAATLLWRRYIFAPFARSRLGGSWMSLQEIYRRLLPYSNDPKIKELIDRVEGALYRGEDLLIDPKELKRVLRAIKKDKQE